MTTPNQQTYSYNRQELPLEKLPEPVRSHITQALYFFSELDKASSHEAKTEVVNNHPYNQEEADV